MTTKRLLEIIEGALRRAELAGADESETTQLREAIAYAADLERSRRAWAEKALETACRPWPEWINARDALPKEEDELVLVTASGKPSENITLKNAYQLANYSRADGWILEEYPELENVEVDYWIGLPEPPEEEDDG